MWQILSQLLLLKASTITLFCLSLFYYSNHMWISNLTETNKPCNFRPGIPLLFLRKCKQITRADDLFC